MECYASRAKLIGLLALACVMVGAAWFCTTLPDFVPRLFGWIGVAFFGFCLVAIVRAFFRSSPQVVIDDAGIWSRRLGVGVIAWADISSLSVGAIHSTKFLCVEVADAGTYLRKLPRWKRVLLNANRALGFPPLSISFTGLTPGLDAVWAHLQVRAGGGAGTT